MIFVVGIIAGLALPIQTSINSCLRYRVKSPYLASMVSMVIAAIFMLVLSLVTHQPLSILIKRIYYTALVGLDWRLNGRYCINI